MYKPVKNLPVARFYYQGSHSHPIRRTILIIEENDSYICGYELREGATVRDVKNAPVKSYSRNRISRYSQLRKRNRNFSAKNKTTLKRMELFDVLAKGV